MRLDFLRCVMCIAITAPSLGACGMVTTGGSDSDEGLADFGVQLGSICGSSPPCAISDELCQRNVLRITACIRDDEMPELPKVRVIERDQLLAELSDAEQEDDEPSRSSIATRNALAALHSWLQIRMSPRLSSTIW